MPPVMRQLSRTRRLSPWSEPDVRSRFHLLAPVSPLTASRGCVAMTAIEPHPPIDPELEAAWPALVETGLTWTNVTPDQIPHMRELFLADQPTDEYLRR